MKQLLSERKTQLLREKTGLDINKAAVRGGRQHKIFLYLNDGRIAMYKDGEALFDGDRWLHYCYPEYARENENIEGYGCAVEVCEERPDGTLWVHNGEYGSKVCFCPFCGFVSKKQISDNKLMPTCGPIVDEITEKMLDANSWPNEFDEIEYLNDYYEGIIESMRAQNIKNIEECRNEFMNRYSTHSEGIGIVISGKNREIRMLKKLIFLLLLLCFSMFVMAIIK